MKVACWAFSRRARAFLPPRRVRPPCPWAGAFPLVPPLDPPCCCCCLWGCCCCWANLGSAGPAGSSTPVVHVTWQAFKSRRGSIDKMVKATPRKKAHHGKAPSNDTPTQSASIGLEQSQLFPDDGQPYLSMDDLPPRKRTGVSKNQVCDLFRSCTCHVLLKA